MRALLTRRTKGRLPGTALEAKDKKPTVVSRLLGVTECCGSLELSSAIAFSCLRCSRRASIASASNPYAKHFMQWASLFLSSLTRNPRSLQIRLKSPLSLVSVSQSVAEWGKMARKSSR